MNELGPSLEQLAQTGQGLLRRVREALSRKQLFAPVTELRRAHRRLARRVASLSGKQQRRVVEELKAQSREIEAQLQRVSGAAEELETFVQQQQATIDGLLREAGLRGPL